MMCLTEQQKREIERMGMFVIEFKRSLMRICKKIKNAFIRFKNAFMRFGNALHQRSKQITSDLHMIQEKYRNLPPKEKYKVVRRLSKCGFTEKQINVMVRGVYHCRNNC